MSTDRRNEEMTSPSAPDKLAKLPERGPATIDIVATGAQFALGLEPSNMGEMFKLATLVSESGMFKMSTPSMAVMSMMTGRELGLPAMTSLRAIHCIPGKDGSLMPCLSAELKESLARAHPAVEYIRMKESTDTRCIYVGKRKDMTEVYEATWDIERAQKAGLLDRGADEKAKSMNNWNRFPRAMLRARARAEIASIVEPAAALGIPTREELEDDRALTIDPRTGEILSGLPEQPKGRDFRRETDEIKLRILGVDGHERNARGPHRRHSSGEASRAVPD